MMNGVFIGKHTRLKQANCWNVKKSYMPDYFYFDRTGYSGWAQMANDRSLFQKALDADQPAADAFFESLYADSVIANKSKSRQSCEPFAHPPRSFIFLPLQLSFDSVLRLSRIEHFRFYEEVRDWAAKHKLDLVVKPHPASKGDPIFRRDCESTKRILRDTRQHEHVHTTNASIHYIISQCEAVFCINSGVGFEALIHNKPVVSAGHSDYHWATHNISQLDDIEGDENWRKPPLSTANIKRFLYFFLTEYLVDIRESSTVKKRIALAVDEFKAARASQ
jgi:capsule polysaccharide export protein KpsC/LpsZ